MKPDLRHRVLAHLNRTGGQALAAEINAERPIVEFNWLEPKVFEVNGEMLIARGRALALAWLLLAGHRYRAGHLPVEAVFPGRRASASALQALDRAADQVRPASASLATCIAAFGVRRGLLIPRTTLPAIVELRSPCLSAAVRRVNFA